MTTPPRERRGGVVISLWRRLVRVGRVGRVGVELFTAVAVHAQEHPAIWQEVVHAAVGIFAGLSPRVVLGLLVTPLDQPDKRGRADDQSEEEGDQRAIIARQDQRDAPEEECPNARKDDRNYRRSDERVRHRRDTPLQQRFHGCAFHSHCVSLQV